MSVMSDAGRRGRQRFSNAGFAEEGRFSPARGWTSGRRTRGGLTAGDRQTDAKMSIEVDLAGIMRAVPGLLKGSIQRVSDREMAAIKAAVESATRGGAES